MEAERQRAGLLGNAFRKGRWMQHQRFAGEFWCKTNFTVRTKKCTRTSQRSKCQYCTNASGVQGRCGRCGHYITGSDLSTIRATSRTIRLGTNRTNGNRSPLRNALAGYSSVD